MKEGDYAEAVKEYQIALDSMPDNQTLVAELEAAKTASAAKERGSKYIVSRMDVFNSRRRTIHRCFMATQFNQLYFTSTRNEAQGDAISGITGVKAGDIFVSEKDDKGKWGYTAGHRLWTEYQG